VCYKETRKGGRAEEEGKQAGNQKAHAGSRPSMLIDAYTGVGLTHSISCRCDSRSSLQLLLLYKPRDRQLHHVHLAPMLAYSLLEETNTPRKTISNSVSQSILSSDALAHTFLNSRGFQSPSCIKKDMHVSMHDSHCVHTFSSRPPRQNWLHKPQTGERIM
jgi:hypothetical protein